MYYNYLENSCLRFMKGGAENNRPAPRRPILTDETAKT